MAIFSNFIQTRPGSVNEISTGSLLIGVTSITSSAANGRDELVSNINRLISGSGEYRLSAFTTIDTRPPLVLSYGNAPFGLSENFGAGPPRAWDASLAAANAGYLPIYYPPMLTVKGDVNSQATFPSLTPTFAANPALLVSGSVVVENDIRSFNTIQGITHIPGNNGLVLGGKPTNGFQSLLDSSTSANLRNNITIFGGGTSVVGALSGQSGTSRNGSNPIEEGAGLNIFGRTINPTNSPAAIGLRFAMETLYGDAQGLDYDRSFVMRILNPFIGYGQFIDRASILQYSYKRNELILGTVEGTFGKTRLISGHQIEITSLLQLGQYVPATQTGEILLAGTKIRLAGSSTLGQTSEVFFDNVNLYATASALPNFGTNYMFALVAKTGSGIYANDPTSGSKWHIGLGIVSGSGGGASLSPGGDNYDIQYNVTQGGAAPRFGGAFDVNRTFEYVYDAQPDALVRFGGRLQGGHVNARADGTGSMAFGRNIQVTGPYSVVFGESNITDFPGINVVAGQFSFMHAHYGRIDANYAHAQGYNPRILAAGQYGHAEGSNCAVSANAAHAEGISTQASANYSHAEGISTNTVGQSSHAEGYGTVTSGEASHAEGFITLASGFSAHAEGHLTTGSGYAAHAEGYLTWASGSYSHAEGIGTVAAGNFQHAEGRYNIPSTTAIWVLGDGASANARHNLIEGHTGSVRFSGSLFVQPGQGYLPFASQSTVLTYNPSTGQIQLMNTSSVAPSQTVQPQYWIQDGTRLYTSGGFNNVQVTGSFYASGSAHTLVGSTTVSGGLFIQPTFVPNVTYSATLTNPSILAYNTTTGQVQRTSLAAVGALPAPPSSSIQFNRNGAFGGTQFFLYSESLNTVFAATQLNIGLNNRVSTGTFGMVMGSGSLASGIGSFAQGFQVTSSGVHSHAQGSASRATGIYSHAEGRQALASGRYDHAEGWLTTSSADYSHAEGYLTRATQDYAHAEGFLTLASGVAAHAEGRQTTASGQYSHAEGLSTQALFQYSHAEGGGTTASGSYAHAEGQGTRALADGAHAEGWFTLATGVYSHAEGRQTTASGQESHAQGRITEAIGSWSFAGGYRTTALGDYQSVLGRYNVPIQDENTVFLIGGGSSAETKNTLLVQTASMQLTGSLYIQDSTWPASGEVYLPRASQSLMLVYNQSTGQVQLMHTASLIPTERDPIFTSRSASLATTGSNIFRGNQTISGSLIMTGSIFVSQSGFPFASQSSVIVYNPTTGQLQQMLTASLIPTESDPIFTAKSASLATTGSNIFIGNQTISGSIFVSQSSLPFASQSSLVVYNPTTGQLQLMLTSSLPKDGYWIQNGSTLFTSGGFSNVQITGSLLLTSASNYQGMRSDLVTRTSIDYDILTGSNNTMHIAPGGLNQATAYFPNNPIYGTTFTLVVDSPGQTTIQTGSITVPGAQPQCRIQSPSSTTFAGATYATQYTVVAAGVYNYMFLNVSSGSVGNAWVLTSKM